MPSEPTTSLSDRVHAEARRHGHGDLLLKRPLVVGVSGGPDSLALLHLLIHLRGGSAVGTLHVAHLDHLVRGDESRRDADFVRGTAQACGVPATIAEFDVPAFARQKRLSIEDAARRARYAFLTSVAQLHGAAIAVAHNADDQVETVLLAILRGTGITGLAGMAPLDSAASPNDDELLAAFPHDATTRVDLLRPLLSVWRHEIENYCRDHGLEPRIDSTNVDQSYRRNRVRYVLIPYLQQHYSLAVKDHLYRLSDIARAEDEAIDSVADQAWATVARVEASGARVSIDSGKLAAQPEALRRRLVRRALHAVSGTLADFSFSHVEEAVAVVCGADGAPSSVDLPQRVRVEHSEGTGIVRLRQVAREPSDLAAACRLPVAPAAPNQVTPGGSVELEHGWTLETTVTTAPHERPPMDELNAAFDYDVLEQAGPLVVRRRAPGDYIQPLGMDGRRSLQDLMVDAKIPRECRAALAVLAPEDTSEVLWVPGPGGRRSGYAPLTPDTFRVLEVRFVRHD